MRNCTEEEDDKMGEGNDSDPESEGQDEEGNGTCGRGAKMRVAYDETMEERFLEASKKARKKRLNWKSDVKQMNEHLEEEILIHLPKLTRLPKYGSFSQGGH